MKILNFKMIGAALAAWVMVAVSVARAQLAFTLAPADQSGAGTNVAVFNAALMNTSASNLVFLNGLQFNFFASASNSVDGDTNTFFANVPGILLPGESYTGAVFGVTLVTNISPSDYFGTVTLVGGSNIFAADSLTSQLFRILWPDSVGDGIPDWWRAEFFGGDGTTTNSQSCAACDADNTSENNLFKYTAGLNPTNASSVFTLKISQTAQPEIFFGPTATGRIYTPQYSPDLTNWFTLDNSLVASNIVNEIAITDPSPDATLRFYRVQIKLP